MYSIKRPSKLAVLTIAVSFALVSTSAISANAVPPSDKFFGDFKYINLFPGAVSITGCKSDPCPANLRIPEKVFGKKVVEIASFAFVNQGVQTTTLPRWLHDIGSNAFAGNNLQTVTIPASVVSIKEAAFQSNSLTKLTFPRNGWLTSIGHIAFESNSLTRVVLPKKLVFVGENAFAGNQLTSVTFLGPRPKGEDHMEAMFSSAGNDELTEIGYAPEQDSWSGFETFSGLPVKERIISVPTIMWPTILGTAPMEPSAGEVVLKVKPPTNASVYRWRVSVDNGATWQAPSVATIEGISWLYVTNLTPGKRYKINVVAITPSLDASRKSIAIYVTPPV